MTEAAYKSLTLSLFSCNINNSGFGLGFGFGMFGSVGVKSSSGVSLISSTGPLTLEKLILAL